MSRLETLRIIKREHLDDPFITAGDRAYLIGAQSGDFPPMGWHSPGKMGGIWTHPIRLLHGLWLAVDGTWLPPAERFVSEAFTSTQEYSLWDGLTVGRQQIAPNGEPAIVVRYSFTSPRSRTISVLFLARIDLQGVWPGLENGPDTATYLPHLRAWLGCDTEHPWAVVVGATGHEPAGWESGNSLDGPGEVDPTGIAVTLEYTIDISPSTQTVLDFVIAGSVDGPEAAEETFLRVGGDRFAHSAKQGMRYEALLDRSVLSAPDPELVRAWDWTKCATEWLVRDVPGVGRGLGGGVESYPWWFGCDSAYALLGALALGRHDLCIETLDLLREASEKANGPTGRVIHECSTSGVVAGRGSVQETPQLISTIWQTFLWTGDLDFLRRSYDFCRRGILDWTLRTCAPDDGLLPLGFGITEREGMDLQCIDSAVYTVLALQTVAGMGEVLGDDAVAADCHSLAHRVRVRLEESFWMEDEGLYGDMLATPAEMIPRIQAWLNMEDNIYYSAHSDAVRAEIMSLLHAAQSDPFPDRKRPWLLKYWIILSPIEAGLAPPERALRVLQRLESPEFSGTWGLFISAVYGHEAMSISTGAMAVAEARYGRSERALRYIHALTDTLQMHMPGGISEILPAAGCFVQEWSAYGVTWPVVTHMFGVHPVAHRKELRLEPRFPTSWTDVHLTNLRIGHAAIDLHWNGTHLAVEVSEPGWTVTVHDSHRTAS